MEKLTFIFYPKFTRVIILKMYLNVYINVHATNRWLKLKRKELIK